MVSTKPVRRLPVGGGSISTYKELCSLATDMGQPDLIYRFMDLANQNTATNSRRGAAFGFASIAQLSMDRLQPHVTALLPKLYRYQCAAFAPARTAHIKLQLLFCVETTTGVTHSSTHESHDQILDHVGHMFAFFAR